MPITYGGEPCVDPASAARQCGEMGVPTGRWLYKANRFCLPLGRTPGSGQLLMARSSVNKLDLNSWADLVFQSKDDEQIKIPRVLVTRCECVTPGVRDDENALMLLEIADRRQSLLQVPVDKGYNLTKQDDPGVDYYYATLHPDAHAPWSWKGLVNDLARAAVGREIGDLPYQPSEPPENWNFYGAYAWDALNDVLDRLCCAVAYLPKDADDFKIVELGAPDQKHEDALRQLDDMRLWDYEPKELTFANVPAQLWVRFTRLPWPGDGSSPYVFKVRDAPDTVQTPVAGQSVLIVPDDASALVDDENNVVADEGLDARADERRDKVYQALIAANKPLYRVYAGFQGIDGILPGPQVHAVEWFDFGSDLTSTHGGQRTGVYRGGQWAPTGAGMAPKRRAARIRCVDSDGDGKPDDLRINWAAEPSD